MIHQDEKDYADKIYFCQECQKEINQELVKRNKVISIFSVKN